MTADTLQRFIFNHTSVRGQIIRLDGTLKTILKQTAYPLEICDLLSQTLCATALLSATLKYEGQLTLQFQSKGPLKMLVAKCDHTLKMRGTARFDEDNLLPGNLQANFEAGELVITIQKNNHRYQSIVEMNHQSISHALENYFLKSEQLDTKLWLAYDNHTQQAVGLLLQKLPDETETQASKHSWAHIEILANTLTHQELLSLETETLLQNLFHEETIQLFEPQPVQFYCPCNAEKMLAAISALGKNDALEILQTNRFIEVTCEYCHNHFEFDANEVKRLFRQH